METVETAETAETVETVESSAMAERVLESRRAGGQRRVEPTGLIGIFPEDVAALRGVKSVLRGVKSVWS